MSNRRVTLIGGAGFVGSQLTFRLATQFDEVVVLTRRSQRVRAFKVLSNVQVQQVDVHDPDALSAALAGSDLVINLVGILNESGRSKNNQFGGAHEDLTANTVAACQANDVRRFLQISALGANAENGSSEYLRSKGRAEQHIHAASDNLAWTIFQPSIIYGEGDSFFNLFARLLPLAPVFPLACPDARMAPVYVGDVCNVMLEAIDDPQTFGETIVLVGPEDFSFRELVEFTAETAGLNRKVIGLPDWAARLQARIMELIPGKPFSRDNYQSLQTDNVGADDCVRQPTSIQAVVPRYIGSRARTAQLQSQRRMARR